jgi:hypothetical protein
MASVPHAEEASSLCACHIHHRIVANETALPGRQPDTRRGPLKDADIGLS